MKSLTKGVALVALSTLFLSLTSCGNNHKNAQTNNDSTPTAKVIDTHNSRNSLDYEGTYTGTLPCADCSGIQTEITLKGDEYILKTVYEGKGKASESTFTESGKYTWDDAGSIITLNHDPIKQYRVGENTLIALDKSGNRITGEFADMYVLKKK